MAKRSFPLVRKEGSDLVPRLDLAARSEAPPLSAREIVASLRADESPGVDVFGAFWELDRLPIDEVREALAPWVGPDPDRHRLDAATCLAQGIPARPLRLRTLSITRDADVLDLGPVAEEQLRLAGMTWDGIDRAAEERLDGELEGSFAGTLEHRVLGDADESEGPPLFDVLLFADDAGVVFAAGSTKAVALIAYRKVEMRDRRTRVALEQAIAAPIVEAIAAPIVEQAIAAPVVEQAIAAPVVEQAIAAPIVEQAIAAPIVEEPATARDAPTAGAPAEKKAKRGAKKKAVAKRLASKTTARGKAPVKKTAAKKPRTTSAAGKKKAAPAKTKAARKSAKKSSR